jgi:formate hydrogenlyase transcriptional activator
MQQRYIRETLEVTGWRISGRKGAAEILGLHPNTLRSKMERLGIRHPGSAT